MPKLHGAHVTTMLSGLLFPPRACGWIWSYPRGELSMVVKNRQKQRVKRTSPHFVEIHFQLRFSLGGLYLNVHSEPLAVRL